MSVPPLLTIPPPPAPGFPFVMVRPEIPTTEGAPISNTLDKLFPLTERLDAPGPLMVRVLLIKSSPVVSVIVPVTLKLMVSPGEVFAIAARRDPAPLSARLVTVIVAPKAGTALKTATIARPAHVVLKDLVKRLLDTSARKRAARSLMVRWSVVIDISL